MRLHLAINFETDGDFYFENPNSIFDARNSMYRNATLIDEVNDEDQENVRFYLIATGDADACRWAARDLMEKIVCQLRTGKYEVIKDVYDLVITPKENYLWSDAEVHYVDCLSGNYTGSYISLTVEHE